MIKNYIFFDFGESYFKDQRVVDLVVEKMPVFHFARSMDHANSLSYIRPPRY